jgi:hypothetical protein
MSDAKGRRKSTDSGVKFISGRETLAPSNKVFKNPLIQLV